MEQDQGVPPHDGLRLRLFDILCHAAIPYTVCNSPMNPSGRTDQCLITPPGPHYDTAHPHAYPPTPPPCHVHLQLPTHPTLPTQNTPPHTYPPCPHTWWGIYPLPYPPPLCPHLSLVPTHIPQPHITCSHTHLHTHTHSGHSCLWTGDYARWTDIRVDSWEGRCYRSVLDWTVRLWDNGRTIHDVVHCVGLYPGHSGVFLT